MNTVTLTSPRSRLWALRVLVVVLAVSMTVAIGNAADSRGSSAAPVATVAWALVTMALVVALVVPSPLALTVVRLLAPGTLPAAVAAVALGGGAVWGSIALVIAVLVSMIALSAEVAEALVQGSAYGREYRLPLRTPAMLVIPTVLVWSVWCMVVLGAVLELAAGHWLLGPVLAVVACVLGWLLAPRLHRLS
ncbi:MAG TPA: hypothetical protein PLP26_03775, partial [Ilumatobacteraceae bacterium]|nr:hypothetical protein [Ilumatobacteraceae bacterium]